MSVILVTHDLGVVAGHTDEIIVMYAGQIVERAPTPVLFGEMRMPYTEALLESIPKLDDPSHTRLRAIAGRPPDLINPPKGCRFSPRCPYVQDRCLTEAAAAGRGRDAGPQLRLLVPGRLRRLEGDQGTAGRGRRRRDPHGRPRRPRGPGGRGGHARRRPDRRPPAGAERGGSGLMAGTGTAHLHPREDSLLRVEDLVVEFPVGRTGLKVNAVSGISLDVLPGETLGLVGESGCGKSTTGRAIMQLPRPTSGSISFDGQELTSLHGDDMRTVRTNIQMIFQDPISSLNPRRKVRDIVLEPLNIWKIGTKEERLAKARQVLEDVGLDPDIAADRRPHQFSGGQCQRISIARALVLEPEADHLRRARLGARRQRAGPGAQPAGGPEAPLRADADVHRPRPGRRQERQRPRRRHVPRQAVRGRGRRRRCTRGRPIRTPTSCSSRSRCPTPRSGRTPTAGSRARSRRRCSRRRAAASGPAALGPRTAARWRSPSCGRSSPTTSWPATSRSSARPRPPWPATGRRTEPAV